MTAIFRSEGFDVTTAHDAASGVAAAREAAPDVVLLDMHLPDGSGLEVLEHLAPATSGTPVVMVTAHADVRAAVRATRLGAYDYLTKPVEHDEVLRVVRRALEARSLRLEVERLRRQVGEDGLAAQMGPGVAVRELAEQVETVARSRFTVLVVGETGAGKELVAQAIHRQSDRRSRPFIALDCGAIPEPLLESELFGHERGAFTGADRKREGHIQLAEGGTLFLDEIGNLPMSLQAKLLRVLESRQVHSVGGERTIALDVRFVAATNDDLQARVHAGLFRADLYFRLAQYTISLPALRERREDIPWLAARFLDEASVELRRPVRELRPDALALLERHPWPGNVRELRNVVRQAVLVTKELVVRKEVIRALLAPSRGASAPLPGRFETGSLREIAAEAARAAERSAICETLRSTKGNKSQAARILQTDYKTLHLKMKSLGVRARDFQPA